jgi:hypothetical protein
MSRAALLKLHKKKEKKKKKKKKKENEKGAAQPKHRHCEVTAQD